MSLDSTAEIILDRLGNLEDYPHEVLAPYEEFEMGGQICYFTSGGFLYRKDPDSEEAGGFFSGYLTDEACHYSTDDGCNRLLMNARAGILSLESRPSIYGRSTKRCAKPTG